MTARSRARAIFHSTVFCAAAMCGLPAATTAKASGGCGERVHDGAQFVVCAYDPAAAEIRLWLRDSEGAPYGHFGAVEKALNARGETLLFAMNAGMYRANRAPVGLFIEDGRVITPANRRDGPGNFHLKPNGVFWLFRSVDPAVPEPWPPFAAVSTTEEHAGAHAVAYATQSGPMLVIDGDIHPRFIKTSDSLKRRNGVGVTEEGDVVFVIADTPVRFYDFAVFFRDELNAPNALYLDGTISRLYAPALGRNDPGLPMGPIVGVVGRK